MDETQAFNIVTQACARMSGTLEEHRMIQEALTVIQNKLDPPSTNGNTGATDG